METDARLALVHKTIRNIPDFPQPGIQFKDISPVLENAEAFRAVIDLFTDACRDRGIQKLAAIDARGFLFASAVAYNIGAGVVLVRKKGKLPYKTESISYSLEYGQATLEVHVDAVKPGERVILIDDLLATGGTADAAIQLLKIIGGDVVEALFLIDLTFLNGRQKLAPTPVKTFIEF